MTDASLLPEPPPDVIDNQVSDVLNEDEIVHVPPAVEHLVESMAQEHTTFAPEVPQWDPDEPPEAAA
jgi:hypothetical protein